MNLQAQRQHDYHFGSAPITRLSLVRLNNQQPARCCKVLIYGLYDRCPKYDALKHGFCFKNPLYALDASLIDLSLKPFPWLHYPLENLPENLPNRKFKLNSAAHKIDGGN